MTLSNARVLQLPPTLLLLLLAYPVNAQLPYTPTRLLQSPNNRSLIYIIRPAPDDASRVEFGSFAGTSSIGEDISLQTLSPSLSFLDDTSRKSFVPAIDRNGNISVYSGRCSAGASGSSLWTFTVDTNDPIGNGTWVQNSIGVPSGGSSPELAGANYLTSGVSFSSVTGGASTFYTFGGMCPDQDTSSDGSTWQSKANYSNLLVTLSDIDGTYTMEAASTGSKPIAEAGFSMTGLAPSYSNNSDGTQTTQQNFVLIGGHTQAAFINMSQVALFSLPQQAWNFLPIEQAETGRTDLTLRADSAAVEPRSGHSAVLSADGTKIIIFGGWIGAIDTAANPQLAVLNIGSGYGGNGAWTWSFPDTTGTQPSAVFGHDAILLDGDVMMVTGGYNIASASGRLKSRAQSSLTASTKTSFFNITSGAWTSSYTPTGEHQPSNSATSMKEGGGALHTSSQKAGLGVGLGLGALAVVALLIFYFWYTRRLRRKREAREQEIDKIAQGTHGFTGDEDDAAMQALGYYGSGPYSEKATQGREDMAGQQGWRSTSGHDVERSGLYVEIPSPTRGLRKGAAGRNGYQPAPHYDEKRTSRASGNIPPIEEIDEEHTGSSGAIGSLQAYHQKKRSNASAFSRASTLDPFTDPLRSHPPNLLLPDKYEISTHPAHQIVAQQLRRDIISDPREAGGRVSPTKSDRTSSTLSEATSRSGISARSAGSGPITGTLVGTLARNLSIRSSGVLNAMGLTATTVDPFKATAETTVHEYPDELDRPRTKGSEKTSSTHDNQSFHSARSARSGAPTGFDKLRAESEALLGGDDPYSTARNVHRFASISYDNATPGQSPTRQDALLPTPRSATFAGGVLGSMRRALGAGSALRSASFTARSPKRLSGRPRSGSGSPTKAGPQQRGGGRGGKQAGGMQRSVSDAGAWKARRSGARDWLGDRYRYGEDWDEDLAHPGEEDWDVERAANERNVQVMFTVPRERLRVVNAEVDARSLLSSVDGDGGFEERQKEVDEAKAEEQHPGTRTL